MQPRHYYKDIIANDLAEFQKDLSYCNFCSIILLAEQVSKYIVYVFFTFTSLSLESSYSLSLSFACVCLPSRKSSRCNFRVGPFCEEQAEVTAWPDILFPTFGDFRKTTSHQRRRHFSLWILSSMSGFIKVVTNVRIPHSSAICIL